MPAAGLAIGLAGPSLPWLAALAVLAQIGWMARRLAAGQGRSSGPRTFPALLGVAAVLLGWSWLLGVAAGLSAVATGSPVALARPLAEATLAGVLIVIHARRHAPPRTLLAA